MHLARSPLAVTDLSYRSRRRLRATTTSRIETGVQANSDSWELLPPSPGRIRLPRLALVGRTGQILWLQSGYRGGASREAGALALHLYRANLSRERGSHSRAGPDQDHLGEECKAGAPAFKAGSRIRPGYGGSSSQESLFA